MKREQLRTANDTRTPYRKPLKEVADETPLDTSSSVDADDGDNAADDSNDVVSAPAAPARAPVADTGAEPTRKIPAPIAHKKA